ncbi:MAG: hypothetical protein JW971_02325 [Synergistales bacterium]|nr:hypothetical protein [Synergistales bacterium]
MSKKRGLLTIVITLVMLLSFCVSSWAAMGKMESLEYLGLKEDMVGLEGSFSKDARPDALFSLQITGAGAIVGFSLQTEDGKRRWDSSPGSGEGALLITDSKGSVVNEGGSVSLLPFILGAGFNVYAANDGFFESQTATYIMSVRFVDGSETSSKVTIQALKPLEIQPQFPDITGEWGAILEGFSQKDFLSKNEQLMPDGEKDVLIRVRVGNKGRVSSMTISNTDGRYSVWDTLPGNGKWPLMVVKDGEILNSTNGSVNFEVREPGIYELYIPDNGSVKAGDTSYEIRLVYSDGKKFIIPVSRKGELTLQGEVANYPVNVQAPGAILFGKADGTAKSGLPDIMQFENDYVSDSERLEKDGQPDWGIQLTPGLSTTIISLKVENINGDYSVWDTLPGNGKWLVAVTDDYGKVLNEPNGSLDLKITEGEVLWLWMSDNGSFSGGRTNYRVTLMNAGGNTYSFEVEKHGLQLVPVRPLPVKPVPSIEFKARYLEKSQKDFVGKYDRISSDRNGDVKIRTYLNNLQGHIVEVILKDTSERDFRWDTVPGNGRWAILVTTPGEEFLNSTDGSVFIPVMGKRTLLLWVADNAYLSSGTIPFEVVLRMEDGRVLRTPLER